MANRLWQTVSYGKLTMANRLWQIGIWQNIVFPRMLTVLFHQIGIFIKVYNL